MHGRIEDYQSPQNVGQGASPGKQGGQKPWETVLIRKSSGVLIDHNSKNQIKRKTSRKSSLTLGDSIINNANMKKAQNMPSNMGKTLAKPMSSKKLNDKVKLGEKNLKTKYSVLKCYNKFSVLEIDDIDDMDANEDIYDETKLINKPKKNKKKRKNNNKIKKKKTVNSKTFQQTQQHAWAMDGKCFTDNCSRKNTCRRKSWKAGNKKKEEMKLKNLTELDRRLVLQRIAILENHKSSKASVIIHIRENVYVSRDNFWPYRLRGGADVENYLSNLQESNRSMVNKAIENARYHGINLYH